MPHTSIVETFNCPLPNAGTMANAMLELRLDIARLELARPDFAMPQKKAVRFPRSARLLRHADFERVYKQGRRHFSASMTVFYLARPQADAVEALRSGARAHGLRVGFTVGRALGGAVQRNRMKRRLREAVRLSQPFAGAAGVDVVQVDVVINPKKSLLTADFTAILNEVRRAFVVIEEKLSQGTESARNRSAESRKPKADSRS